MRLRPALRGWLGRWLRPSFVWPEARHEQRVRRRYPLTGVVSTDLTDRFPRFVTGRGEVDELVGFVGEAAGCLEDAR